MKFFKPLALAMVTCGVMLGSAHAQQEPGLTDKSIKIGTFAPLSGNSMAYGFDVLNAAKCTAARSNWWWKTIAATPTICWPP